METRQSLPSRLSILTGKHNTYRPTALLTLWIVTPYGGHGKFANSKRFLNVQRPKMIQNQTCDEFEVSLATLACPYYMEALVLNTKHVNFALHTPSDHATTTWKRN